MAEERLRLQLRLPPELHDRIQAAAAAAHRPMNAEVVYRLEKSLDADGTPKARPVAKKAPPKQAATKRKS